LLKGVSMFNRESTLGTEKYFGAEIVVNKKTSKEYSHITVC